MQREDNWWNWHLKDNSKNTSTHFNKYHQLYYIFFYKTAVLGSEECYVSLVQKSGSRLNQLWSYFKNKNLHAVYVWEMKIYVYAMGCIVVYVEKTGENV